MRPLLGALFLQIFPQEQFPPSRLQDLLRLLSSSLVGNEQEVSILQDLLQHKITGSLTEGPRIPQLDHWIESLIESAGKYAKDLPIVEHPAHSPFSDFMFQIVMNTNYKQFIPFLSSNVS
jgi:hypothetical protein